MRSETDLSRSIRKALTAAGIMVERIQSGVIPARGRRIHCASIGTPDLWAQYGFLEVKLPGENPTAEQLEWHARARRAGVRVAVVHSESEALETVLAWRREG